MSNSQQRSHRHIISRTQPPPQPSQNSAVTRRISTDISSQGASITLQPSSDTGREFRRAIVTREAMRQRGGPQRDQRRNPAQLSRSFVDSDPPSGSSPIQSFNSDSTLGEYPDDILGSEVALLGRRGKGYGSIEDPVLRDITLAAMNRMYFLTLFVNPWPSGSERVHLLNNAWRHSCNEIRSSRARTTQCDKIVTPSYRALVLVFSANSFYQIKQSQSNSRTHLIARAKEIAADWYDLNAFDNQEERKAHAEYLLEDDRFLCPSDKWDVSSLSLSFLLHISVSTLDFINS